jgi:branched-chain amino acid transport system ATP-binding protein
VTEAATGLSLLEARGIFKRWGAVVVADGIDLHVAAGSIVGVIGPNGAGKTTLLDILGGDLRPDAGRILLDGHDISRAKASRRARLGIGRTYQIPRPFAGLTVFENALVAVQQAGGHRGADSHDRAAQAIRRCGLASRVNVAGADLRLLDRKRLELARAVAAGPSLVLLDEVAGGLTEAEVGELTDIVISLREEGMTFLWVEHVVRALTATADRIVCVSGGRVIAEGVPHDVLSDPVVVESYFGSPAFFGAAS